MKALSNIFSSTVGGVPKSSFLSNVGHQLKRLNRIDIPRGGVFHDPYMSLQMPFESMSFRQSGFMPSPSIVPNGLPEPSPASNGFSVKNIGTDGEGRTEYQINLPSSYESMQDFVDKAPDAVKLELLNQIQNQVKGSTAYRLNIDIDPATKKLRFVVAVSQDPHFTNWNWDSETGPNKKNWKGKPVAITNNPLYDKAGPDYEKRVDDPSGSKNFTIIQSYNEHTDTYNPNHLLVLPNQTDGYKDLDAFFDAPDNKKLELFNVLAKNSNVEKGDKLHINGRKSREIPWMHFHIYKK